MDYRLLGRTGARGTKLYLDYWMLDTSANEQESVRLIHMIHAALDTGIDFWIPPIATARTLPAGRALGNVYLASAARARHLSPVAGHLGHQGRRAHQPAARWPGSFAPCA